MDIKAYLFMLVLFSIIAIGSAQVLAEEYWTGTPGNDHPAAIVTDGSTGYYVVWDNGVYLYITLLDYQGNIYDSRRIEVVGASVASVDAVVNNSIIYILAKDLNNNTRFYVIKYNISSASVEWARVLAVTDPGTNTTFPSKPRSIIVNGSSIYVLTEHSSAASIISLDPKGSLISLGTYLITNATFADMVNDEQNLYIVGSTYLYGYYYLLLMKIDLTLWPYTIIGVKVNIGENNYFIRGKSLDIDQYSVYVLAGIGAGSGAGQHAYMGFFRFKKANLYLVANKIYSIPGYYVGFDEVNGNKLVIGDVQFYVTGYLVNQTKTSLYDILIVGADLTTLNITWAKKWNSTDGDERGSAIMTSVNYVLTAGSSPTHTGLFTNVSYSEYVGASISNVSISGEFAEYDGVVDNVSCNVLWVSRSSGGFDVVVLSLVDTGIPAPIPEHNTVILALSLILVVAVTTIVFIRVYRGKRKV